LGLKVNHAVFIAEIERLIRPSDHLKAQSQEWKNFEQQAPVRKHASRIQRLRQLKQRKFGPKHSKGIAPVDVELAKEALPALSH
jgi:hypothetical protein